MKRILQAIIPKCYGLFFSAYVLIAPRKTAEMAFKVFCKVRKGRIRPDQKEFLFPAKKEVVSSNNHQIQVYEWPGEGPTILLVHGWESNTWRWHKLIAHLQRAKYRILAFDAPGHGGSSGSELYVPLYAKVTHDLLQRYKPTHIIGHSVGGMTILFNEFKNPDPHIEKMVTIGAPSEFHEIMHHYQQLLGFSNRVMAAVDDFVQARFGFTIEEFSSARFAVENQKKGLLLHDQEDPITPYHASESVHAHWKGSLFISTKGLGHSMHQDGVNEKIVAFLDH